jgi:hypothetical protein
LSGDCFGPGFTQRDVESRGGEFLKCSHFYDNAEGMKLMSCPIKNYCDGTGHKKVYLPSLDSSFQWIHANRDGIGYTNVCRYEIQFPFSATFEDEIEFDMYLTNAVVYFGRGAMLKPNQVKSEKI